MTALELFRTGMDTVQIADHLGVTEALADRMLSACFREERARQLGCKMEKPTRLPKKRPIRFAGYDARERP